VNYRPSHREAEHRVKGERHCSFHLRSITLLRFGLPLRMPLAQFQLLQWPGHSVLIASRNIPS
jgi:hypothetical protein